jgi:predicted permease
MITLVPVALLIALGYSLKRTNFLANGFWGQAERLGYYILLPALFFHALATANMGELPIKQMVIILIGALIAGSFVLVVLRPIITIDGPGFTSVFQGGIRFNNYVAVGVASSLFGAEGVALSAVCNAIIVPTVNILCVLVFIACSSAKISLGNALKQLLLNPLLLACMTGVLFQVFSLKLPLGIDPALTALGQASLGLGLLCVGAALEFSAIRKWIAPLLISSSIKFIALPVVTLILIFGTGRACGSGRSDLPDYADSFIILHHGTAAGRGCALDGRHNRTTDHHCGDRDTSRPDPLRSGVIFASDHAKNDAGAE